MSHALQHIAVLVSLGRHPLNGTQRYSRNDAAALEIARHLAQQHDAHLDVLHAGDPADTALEDYLALGAARIEVLACEPSCCDLAALFAARVQGYDLVLTGTCAEGAFDSGLLPYQLATALDYPLLSAVVDVSVSHDPASLSQMSQVSQVSQVSRMSRLHARQFLPKGRRRAISVTLPAVVAIHPLATAQPRYAYARLRAGVIDDHSPVPGISASILPTSESDAWTLVTAGQKPRKLAAPEKRSGHARMLSATTSESRGGSVVIEGSSSEKAQVILDYLREHQLIDY
nr:electron transfer flavoprotein subunit beta/FixA family protein [Paraburkholderia bonniea]